MGDCLRADAPGSVRPLALMYGSDSNWEACGQLAECIRTGQTAYRILHDVDNLFMMIAHGTARERCARELETLLSAAGLRLIRIVPTPAPVSLVEAMPA